ncbi:hypothetical protein CI109_101552 [Kwoniella shandongensis]|uniref:Uncharacterized protein n=1 Tax=Kwoniella shandongensis TaxID=1734106 RepID=A0A5M6C9M7_9TREE|nr:uncharacterized protein CI109_001316 [Kwoniella shandongensis]KAA5530512.1 hypothetical protein CI109_001316 [Kwoniella shandongensis]
MPHSTSRTSTDDDDMSDMVKISPPSSSPSLMSYTTSIPSIKSESMQEGYAHTHSDIGSRASSFEFSDPSADSTISGSTAASGPPRSAVPVVASEGGRKVRSDQEVVQDAQSAVEDTVRRVREQSDKFQLAARPYADKIRSFAEDRPVLFTFIALWTIISAIPVSFFLGFTILATLTIASVAAFFVAASVIGIILFAIASLAGTILLALTFLLPVLFITTVLTLVALSTLLSLFLAHRLYLHLSVSTSKAAEVNVQTLSTGVQAFVEETLERISIQLPASLKFAGRAPVKAEPVKEGGLRWADDEKISGGGGGWIIDEKKALFGQDAGEKTPTSILDSHVKGSLVGSKVGSGRGIKYNVSVPLPLGLERAPAEYWDFKPSSG